MTLKETLFGHYFIQNSFGYPGWLLLWGLSVKNSLGLLLLGNSTICFGTIWKTGAAPDVAGKKVFALSA